jgi:hypothetical protein
MGWKNYMRREVYAPIFVCDQLKPEEFVREFSRAELMHPWARRRGSRPPKEYMIDDAYATTKWNRTKPFEKEG